MIGRVFGASLVLLVAVGCTAASAQPASSMDSKHLKAKSTVDSDAALSNIENDLRAVQSTLADQADDPGNDDLTTDVGSNKVSGMPMQAKRGLQSMSEKIASGRMGASDMQASSMTDPTAGPMTGTMKRDREGMAPGANGSMPMKGGAKKMCCGAMSSMMGKPSMPMAVPSTGSAKESSSTSGHLLHVGERDFYIDLQAELELTENQVVTLGRHRSRWFQRREAFQADIDETETRLWRVTQALAPDPDQVSVVLREVETLRSAQRLAFIEALSHAVATLTPAQIAKARSLPYRETP